MGDWLGTGTIAHRLREYRSAPAAALLAPYFHRRNGPNARAASATERMRQMAKRLAARG